MKKTGLAEFKAHLAQFVRLAKSGEEIEIHDRGVPVALLKKAQSKNRGLVVTPPSKKPSLFSKFKFRTKLISTQDVVALLCEDRVKR